LGTLGGLIRMASLAIPGLGLIVVAGPIAAALTDAAAGGAVGVIAGALMGMRIPEHRAQQYERSVREGNILISIHTRDTEALKRALNILATGGAEDLHEVVETSADSQSL
jgi:H+/gluconate symporter-like permease